MTMTDKIFVFQSHYTRQHNASKNFLRHVLKHIFHIEAFVWIQPPQGKPFLKDGPFFNISHSHNKIVIALSFHEPLGVDIEYIHPSNKGKPNIQKLMKRYFTKSEQESVGDSFKKFYELWTKKEAFVKLLGRSVLSPEFKHHAQFPMRYQKIEMDGFIGHICRLMHS